MTNLEWIRENFNHKEEKIKEIREYFKQHKELEEICKWLDEKHKWYCKRCGKETTNQKHIYNIMFQDSSKLQEPGMELCKKCYKEILKSMKNKGKV